MDDTAEPVFRANKRRKVYRKRADSADEDESRHQSAEVGEQERDLQSRTLDDAEDVGEGSALRLQKRPGARKHGIGFSSVEGRKATQQDDAGTALVPASQEASADVQIDRFVKPLGREMVAEDKNMMAYVDSKLAEIRSAANLPAQVPAADSYAEASSIAEADPHTAAAGPMNEDERALQAAQARSDRVYQRPTKRPRKKKYERGEEDIARDAYIDQFMQEAQVPMYDRSSAKAAVDAHAGGDNDAATAEAFKAQLLEDMQNRRRRPPKSASAQAANVSNGPKLGGSRQQREKMRAMQEAEGKK